MKRRILLILCLVLGLVPLVTACGQSKAEDEKYILRIGTTLAPEHSVSQAAEYFSERVGELTDGRVEVWTFTGATLGSEKQMIESMMAGGLDFSIATQAPLTNWIPEMQIMDLPFLIQNEDEADYILGGEVGDYLLSTLPDYGLYGYGWAENGFRQLTNSKRPVKVPDDIDGMLIRTMENLLMMDVFSAWGGSPTPLPSGEVYTGLQQGTVDGQENPVTLITSQKYYEPQDYLTYTSHFYSPCIFYGSKARMDLMPEEVHEAIKMAAAEACEFQKEMARQQEQKDMLELEKHLECYTPTDDELQEWIDGCASIYEDYGPAIGQDLIDKTQALLADYRENGGKE